MMRGYGWNGFGDGWFGMGSGYFSIWGCLIFVGIILLIIALFISKKPKGLKDDNAVEILKLLFVKGEITEEEYLKRKNVMERK